MIEILDEPERGNRPKPGFRPSLAILVTVLVAVVVYGATLPSGPADSSSNGYVVDSDHPGLAEVGWAAIDGPWLADDVADSGAAMVRTDDRIIVAARRDWRTLILESTDDGTTWSEAYLHDRVSRVVDGASTATEAFLLGTGVEGAMIWYSSDDEPGWSVRVLDEPGLEDVLVAHLHVGDTMVAVGQGLLGDRIQSIVWYSEDGLTWTATWLPVTDDADVIANSAAMMGDTIVVGGLLARGVTDRGEDPFPDETWRKPVVWTSTDSGATWVQHLLRPTGDLKGVVADVFVADGRFYASGYISNAAPTTLDLTDVDVALWSSSNGSAWTGKITPTPGRDFVKAVLRSAEGWQLLGGTRQYHQIGDHDWEEVTDTKTWSLHEEAWQSPASVVLDGDLSYFAGVVPTTDGWLIAKAIYKDSDWDPILLEGTPQR